MNDKPNSKINGKLKEKCSLTRTILSAKPLNTPISNQKLINKKNQPPHHPTPKQKQQPAFPS